MAIGAILLLGGGYWASSFLGDPFRQLPEFPIEKYFAEKNALAGVTFRADLRVDADLGWEPTTGRLLVFNLLEGKGDRLAVLIPPEIANVVFDKNQAYRVEIEVNEGGIIRAKSFKKL